MKSEKKGQKTSPDQHVKYFDDQFDDEDVMYVYRRHPIVMRRGLIWGGLGLLLGPLAVLIWTYVAPNNPPTMLHFYISCLASLVLCTLLFMPSWMGWYFSVFIMTNQRFIQITQTGFFRRNVSDISLHLIQSINYEIMGIEATILNYGTIIMQTYVGDVHMHHLYHPSKVQRRMVDIMRELGLTASTELIKNMRAEHGNEAARTR